MTRNETNDIITEQVASDARPDHVSRLVHAIRIGGVDFAIDVLADMHDVNSDEERDALMARAEAVSDAVGPIDPATPGAVPLQRIAEILGAPENYWTVRSWTSQGCPHEGYGSTLRCDPVALAAWCAAKADGISSEPEAHRFRTLAQRLADHAALQAA
ncbi:hypothetical protein MKK55_07800 [Methylobacterium sp. J-059]|uniref:hypothetical protein n=1 Tax=Methylobacterium sp. J-059 TaxID=2836643 RepID=UPI001FBA0827|nr:hypothetical protein [Methylobacterium sp. J-059]MCJ2038857.1 hypothetical protein [Methylobacterium sp. J-059]